MAAPFLAAVIRILFIGNSLTQANDLPARVAETSGASGEQVQVETIAFPDHGLEEHWARGDARRAIARGGWTFVVLQQGPSALPESRVLLVDYTRRFDREIRKVGARTALYMVWPSARRRGDFPAVSQSYSAAAREVGGVLLPVGDAWREVWRQDGSAELYGPDGFHPSQAGTAVAARVIAKGLLDCWYHHC